MALISADRIRDTTTTTGTSAFIVTGTAPTGGYRTFSAVCTTNDTFYYCAQGQTTSEWEVGLGTYSSTNTITRTTIIASSNSGSAVSFSAGTKDIFITLAASKTVQLDADGNASVTNTLAMGSSFLRNRIINGDMRIDQRNAGAAVTADNTYLVDRFIQRQSTGGVISYQQSTTVPSGFTNSLSASVTTADSSIAASDIYWVGQRIEGLNVADLAFGTASAANITLSFWVRSNVTGTFGGGITNGAGDRSYVFQYTISSADTWVYKSITIPGDTTGTWLTTNGNGMAVQFDMGSGSNFNGTANTWNSGSYRRVSGNVQLVGTLSNNIYITGVQLEVGSVATPFERRQYGQELALCERYYQLLNLTPGGRAETTTYVNLFNTNLVTMRATPTGSFVGTISVRDLTGTITRTATSPSSLTIQGNNTGQYIEFGASSWSPANFTAGNQILLLSTGLNGIGLSSEL